TGSRRQTGPCRLLRSLAALRSCLALPLDLRAQALLVFALLGRERRTEVLGLVEGPDLDLRFLARHRVRAAPDPLDRFLERLHLPDPVAGDQLPGFRERPVDDRALAAGAAEAHALALAAGLES